MYALREQAPAGWGSSRAHDALSSTCPHERFRNIHIHHGMYGKLQSIFKTIHTQNQVIMHYALWYYDKRRSSHLHFWVDEAAGGRGVAEGVQRPPLLLHHAVGAAANHY
eukprot:COSAG02_NODE_36257_length_457_cov_0.712291_1_plen_108_part_01